MNALQRRKYIMGRREEGGAPVSATVLAGELSVSRQIIVGDVALLRAGGSSRYDVAEFIRKVSESGSKPLSDLTGGIHLHTLRCPDESAFGRVTAELRAVGYLLE